MPIPEWFCPMTSLFAPSLEAAMHSSVGLACELKRVVFFSAKTKTFFVGR